MDWSKTTSVFHCFITTKNDVCNHKVALSRHFCPCKMTLPKHQQFWTVCTKAFESIDELLSMALHLLCETNSCFCWDKLYKVVDKMYKLAQSVLFTLANYHNDQGITRTMLDNEPLHHFFVVVIEKAHLLKNKVLSTLHQCRAEGHDAVLTKYAVCFMEQ